MSNLIDVDTASYENVLSLARKAKGEDHYGYRSEFIRLVEIYKFLEKGKSSSSN